MNYTKYIESQTQRISNCLAELGCQPIIFVGAGLSKRYTNGPSWIELLQQVASQNPEVEKDVAYYLQKHGTLLEVGEQLRGGPGKLDSVLSDILAQRCSR